MFGFGMTELLVIILVVVIFVYGGKRLPQIGEGIGRSITEFKKAIRSPSSASPPAVTKEPPGERKDRE